MCRKEITPLAVRRGMAGPKIKREKWVGGCSLLPGSYGVKMKMERIPFCVTF